MTLNGIASADGPASRHALLEQRYQHTEDELAGATALYEALEESSGGSERQLRQSLQRVKRLQKQLTAIQHELDRLDEEQS